jgi:hypothetical protein
MNWTAAAVGFALILGGGVAIVAFCALRAGALFDQSADRDRAALYRDQIDRASAAGDIDLEFHYRMLLEQHLLGWGGGS